MDRRRFLRALPALPVLPAGAGCGLLAISTAGCSGFRYVRAREDVGRLTVARDTFAGFPDTLVESSLTTRPIYLREALDGSFTAVVVECTHRGCQPEPGVDRLICPCHGSEFTFGGEVLQGPAEAPLTSFQVSAEDGDISIWLDRRVNR